MILLLGLALLAHPALLASDPWTSNGLWGGNVPHLLSLPDGTLLAGTDAGIYRSSDGRTFAHAPGSPFAPVSGFARRASGRVLAATATSLYLSTDSGATWFPIASPARYGSRVAADPEADGTIYVSAFDPASSSASVATSTDSGATWSAALMPTSVNALAAPAPGIVIAGTWSSGIFRSTDSGQTWSESNAGLTNLGVGALAFDPAQPAVLFAGTDDGLFRSTDGGAGWSPLYGAGATRFVGVETSGAMVWAGPASPDTILRSTDGGDTWNWSASGFSGMAEAFARDGLHPGTLFVGSFLDGVFRSEDSGVTWTLAAAGLDARTVSRIASDRATRTMQALADQSFFGRASGGTEWQRLPLVVGSDLVSDGGFRVAATTLAGVYRSTDHGTTWRVTPAPPQSSHSLAWTWDGGDLVAASYDGKVTTSPADGTAWTAFGSGVSGIVLGLAATPDDILVATSSGIWSGNGGAFSGQMTDQWFESVTVDARGDGWATIWPTLMPTARVLHRPRGSASWSDVTPLPSGCYEIRAHPSRPLTLFAATLIGVLRSRDGGQTWEGIGLYGRPTRTLAVGFNGTVLDAGLEAGGVWSRSLVDPTGFYPVTPCRAVDTRWPAAPLGGPALAAGERTFVLAGACGVPADAKSVAVNLTVVNPAADGSLTVFPGDEVAPNASASSFRAGRTRANNATLPVSQDGSAALTVKTAIAAGTTDFIVDVTGYFR